MTTTADFKVRVATPKPPARKGRWTFRRQLPVYSPIDAAGLLRSATAIARRDDAVVASFVELLGERYRCERVVPCASGTTALTLALKLACRARGETTAAVPAYACYDIATAIRGAGLSCVPYDLNPDTLGPEPASFERALRSARVAVVAPLYGIPVDWTTLENIANARDAILIEDAAQGHGALWRDVRVGALGPCTVLSFGRGKGWSGGGGGALLLRDPMLTRLAGDMMLRRPGNAAELGALAASTFQWLLGRPSIYAVPSSLPALGLGETRYHPPGPPLAIARGVAALAQEYVRDADDEVEMRRRNADEYSRALAGRVAIIQVPPEGQAGYLRFPVRIAGGMSGLSHADRARALGAGPPYPLSLPELPALKDRVATGAGCDWPGARELVGTLLTLPTHSYVCERDRARLLDLLPDEGQ